MTTIRIHDGRAPDHSQDEYILAPTMVGWGGDHLVRNLFDQDTYWIDRFSKQVDLSTAHPVYLLNILLFLERNAYEITRSVGKFDDWLYNTVLYQNIKLRVLKEMGVDVDIFLEN